MSKFLEYLKSIEEDTAGAGTLGGGATTSTDIAIFANKISTSTKSVEKRVKKLNKKKVRDFIEENIIDEKTTTGRGLTIFDIDETLLKTFAKVHVIKNGEIVRKLDNQEFNSDKLQDGESYNFSEFRNSEKFFRTSLPIEKNIRKIIEIEKNASPIGSKVIMLTARSDFDDKKRFLDTFRKYGVNIDKIYVERAGNRMKNGGSISKIKADIISDYLSTGEYRRVRLYDDYINNCKELLELRDNLPQEIENKVKEKWDILENEDIIEFFAFHIKEDGSSKRIK